MDNMSISEPQELNREDEHIYANETINLNEIHIEKENSDTKKKQPGNEINF